MKAIIFLSLIVLSLAWVITSNYKPKTVCYLCISICLVWILGASYGSIPWRGGRYEWRGPFSMRK